MTSRPASPLHKGNKRKNNASLHCHCVANSFSERSLNSFYTVKEATFQVLGSRHLQRPTSTYNPVGPTQEIGLRGAFVYLTTFVHVYQHVTSYSYLRIAEEPSIWVNHVQYLRQYVEYLDESMSNQSVLILFRMTYLCTSHSAQNVHVNLLLCFGIHNCGNYYNNRSNFFELRSSQE